MAHHNVCACASKNRAHDKVLAVNLNIHIHSSDCGLWLCPPISCSLSIFLSLYLYITLSLPPFPSFPPSLLYPPSLSLMHRLFYIRWLIAEKSAFLHQRSYITRVLLITRAAKKAGRKQLHKRLAVHTHTHVRTVYVYTHTHAQWAHEGITDIHTHMHAHTGTLMNTYYTHTSAHANRRRGKSEGR